MLRAMSATSTLLALARCPGCRGALAEEDDSLRCDACGSAYPIQGGVPWLYRDVAGSRSQWAAKLQQFRQEVLAERGEIEKSLADESLLEATRMRLSADMQGLERLGEQVFSLLEPFAFAHSEAGGPIPRDRIPTQQHVSSYLETAFRDWVWGETEIEAAFEPIAAQLPAAGDAARVLVLGGGAGRFAFELARRCPGASVLQLDLNPLLTRIAALVSGGESVTLTERPRFPQGVEHVAVDQVLRAPEDGMPERLAFVVGDAFAPPVETASFDWLLTPWFVDIVPEAFTPLVARLGSLLAPGGRWISFGPTSFEAQGPANRVTPDEMCEILEAAGFEIEIAGLDRVDYLHSPHGMQRRGEEVFVFSASKADATPAPGDYDYYPSWMTDGRVAIPLDPRFETMRAEKTFDVEILKCIDGRTGIEDLVVILSSRYGLEPDRCRNTINRFFARFFEDADGS